MRHVLLSRLWTVCCLTCAVAGCTGPSWQPAFERPAEIAPNFGPISDGTAKTDQPAWIHVRGLVNLVSDGSSNPSSVLFLLPDARHPDEVNIGKTFSYRTKHHPRLYLLAGEPTPGDGWKRRYRCHDDGKQWAYDLAGKQLSIAGTGVRVDRSPATPENDSSLNHLPRIDDLLLSPLGRIPHEMRSGPYAGKRLATRVVVESGWLQATGLWELGGSLKTYKFHEWNGNDLGASTAADGRPLAIGMVLVLPAERVVFEECALEDPDDADRCRTIAIEPNEAGERVRLSLENTPGKNDCDGNVHFSAHYLLRERSESDEAGKVLVPATEEVTGVDPHYDNAQCSPAENVP